MTIYVNKIVVTSSLPEFLDDGSFQYVS